MQKTSGFTLVELIVVIAILGILAGIAVPVYSGYIAKAREAADLQQLDAVKTAVFARFMEEPPDGDYDFAIASMECTTRKINGEERYAVCIVPEKTLSADDDEIDDEIILDYEIDVTPYLTVESAKVEGTWTWTPATGWKKE